MLALEAKIQTHQFALLGTSSDAFFENTTVVLLIRSCRVVIAVVAHDGGLVGGQFWWRSDEE